MNNTQNQITDLRKSRTQTLTKIVSSKDEYRKYLDFSAKMFKYTFGDSLLIYNQNPDAQAVAGYDDWKRIGRGVRRSPKTIFVLDTKDPNRFNRLYDLSDTYGEPFIFSERYCVDHSKNQPIFHRMTIQKPTTVFLLYNEKPTLV